ncbi:MAG TPA: heme-binding protein [Candidatus Limnocylindrales bacterium]|nr:heme-binding protein [Candidatus Limnocylindrales bacterium]
MRTLFLAVFLLGATRALAQPAATCDGLPSHDDLRGVLQTITGEGSDANTGMGNPSWAAVVNRDGIVCAVVFSGPDRSAEWPGSRVIAAEKASTANALSAPNFALSTANLYFASQPGQSLFGLTASAPPNPDAAYGGSPEKFGQADDPMIGKPIGGIVVFGGGLALYDSGGKIVGGLGVSGDTSCADHVVAWKVRHALNLDAVPVGVAKNVTDNMILDIRDGTSVSGFGHPSCKGGKASDDVINSLAEKVPVGPGK